MTTDALRPTSADALFALQRHALTRLRCNGRTEEYELIGMLPWHAKQLSMDAEHGIIDTIYNGRLRVEPRLARLYGAALQEVIHSVEPRLVRLVTITGVRTYHEGVTLCAETPRIRLLGLLHLPRLMKSLPTLTPGDHLIGRSLQLDGDPVALRVRTADDGCVLDTVPLLGVLETGQTSFAVCAEDRN